jgi:hypothetical protein
MVFRKYWILAVGVVIFCLGFRSIPNANNWPIDRTSVTNSKIFVTVPNGARAIENDLPSSDPLAGTATVAINSLMSSIFDDYNGIDAAFVTLAGQSDPDYPTNSIDRVIEIREGNPNGLFSGGEAKQLTNGREVRGCIIYLKAELFQKARDFVKTVTHEVGHCLGLDHPQEITRSIMSYFQDDEYRLQDDDKMGITYLYPLDAGAARESANFGLSCERRH